jgi:hypothetical protein
MRGDALITSEMLRREISGRLPPALFISGLSVEDSELSSSLSVVNVLVSSLLVDDCSASLSVSLGSLFGFDLPFAETTVLRSSNEADLTMPVCIADLAKLLGLKDPEVCTAFGCTISCCSLTAIAVR